MPLINRREKRAARQLAKAEGINYTAALRLVREAHDAGRALASSHPADPAPEPQPERVDFVAYRDRITTGREPGVAKLDWSPGVLHDGALVRDSFTDGQDPHLLITGGPGSGKSVLLYSLMFQILYSNGPAEARIWIVDPTDSARPFGDHVEFATPPMHAFSGGRRQSDYLEMAADLMEDAVREMDRRFELFGDHPETPNDFLRGRVIAARESNAAGTPADTHPLHLPSIFIVVEECYTLFDESLAGPAQLRFRAAVEAIAKRGRSAGLRLICSAYRATEKSFPRAVLQHSRAIGVKRMPDPLGNEPLFVGRTLGGGDGVDFRPFDVPRPAATRDGNGIEELLRAVPRWGDDATRQDPA